MNITKKIDDNKKNFFLSEILPSLPYILLVMAVIFCLSNFRLSKIKGNSMNNTYKDGQLVIESIHADVNRGDIITFNGSDDDFGDGKRLIKRVIGVGGDTIEIRGGKTYVNGQEIDEPYAVEDNHKLELKITLEEDELFVLGDNRPISNDSRRVGPIKKSAVVGVVINIS